MATNFEPSAGQAAEVVVEDLRKAFDGVEVLRGVNLRVRPREIYVVMGSSGCGKTVLLRHIIGLETPDGGRVLVGGRDVSDPLARQTLNLAMVFQSSALFNSMTVAENVGLWLHEHRRSLSEEETQKIVGEKLTLLGLDGADEKFPAELSGGMRKRVAVARALVMNPNLILYDEPTSELDPIRAANIAEIIRTLKQKVDVTSLVVTHDRDLAFAVADRVGILHEGKIVAEGTPAEIRASANAVVREFLQAEHTPRAGQ